MDWMQFLREIGEATLTAGWRVYILSQAWYLRISIL